jgi:hypothetical protein
MRAAYRPEDLPALQRLRALAALTACAPLQGGDSLIAEVYSPHLDIYQRLLILDVLGAAAQVRKGGGPAKKIHPDSAQQAFCALVPCQTEVAVSMLPAGTVCKAAQGSVSFPWPGLHWCAPRS